MSYLILDPTCKELMSQLREADRRRDELRARLADAALKVELSQVGDDLKHRGFSEEEIAPIKAEREAAIKERIALRAKRRATEMERFGTYVPPGTWDADLDKYQEPQYEEDIGDGYKIRLKRAGDLTWNAYVILPSGHALRGMPYDRLPFGAPVNITYGGPGAEDGVYGFYLSHTLRPYNPYPRYDPHYYFSAEDTGYNPLTEDGSNYMNYRKMRALCLKVVDYFKVLAG